MLPSMLYSLFAAALLPLVLEICAGIQAKRRGLHLPARRYLWVFIFVFYLSEVLSVTGLPVLRDFSAGGHAMEYFSLLQAGDEYNLIPFADMAAAPVSYVLNFFLFVPFGCLWARLYLGRARVWTVALAGFLLSAYIETLQLFNVRFSDVNDLIMNTLGAAAGCLVFLGMRRLWMRGRQRMQPPGEGLPLLLRWDVPLTVAGTCAGVFLLGNP